MTRYGIVAQDPSRSWSPELHGRCYAALGIDAVYERISGTSLQSLLHQPDLQGLTVAAPFKEEAVALADAVGPYAARIGCANTLVRRDGGWFACTVDTEIGAALGDVSGRAAVVGCGGAGRAAVAVLVDAGLDVVLVNRTVERGRRVARELGVPFVPLAAFHPDVDVLVHATPVDGLLDVQDLPARALVAEYVYGAVPTGLVRDARARGLRTIDGLQMLAREMAAQFRLMTGHEPPADVIAAVIRDRTS